MEIKRQAADPGRVSVSPPLPSHHFESQCCLPSNWNCTIIMHEGLVKRAFTTNYWQFIYHSQSFCWCIIFLFKNVLARKKEKIKSNHGKVMNTKG